MSSFNSNTNIRDGEKGAEEEDNMIDRDEFEKAVFPYNLKLSRETNGDKQVVVCGPFTGSLPFIGILFISP